MRSTREAIIDVLSKESEYLDAEEIFIRLNAEKKTYSYAAVYSNVRKLNDLGVLAVQSRANDRKKYFASLVAK